MIVTLTKNLIIEKNDYNKRAIEQALKEYVTAIRENRYSYIVVASEGCLYTRQINVIYTPEETISLILSIDPNAELWVASSPEALEVLERRYDIISPESFI